MALGGTVPALFPWSRGNFPSSTHPLTYGLFFPAQSQLPHKVRSLSLSVVPHLSSWGQLLARVTQSLWHALSYPLHSFSIHYFLSVYPTPLTTWPTLTFPSSEKPSLTMSKWGRPFVLCSPGTLFPPDLAQSQWSIVLLLIYSLSPTVKCKLLRAGLEAILFPIVTVGLSTVASMQEGCWLGRGLG